MDKDTVDRIITEYTKKIYNFALFKTKNIDSAEDLASRITLEVYKSLLKSEVVHNVTSYVYRIARNIYSQFITEMAREEQVLMEEYQQPYENNNNKDKSYLRIRDEITYLSDLQRKIVVMHYYDKYSLKEISKRLNLPHGTVRWHLFEARNHIKNSFNDNEYLQSSVCEKIRFSKINFYGFLENTNVNRSYFFAKTLSQLVAYSAYTSSKTAIEIAKEVSVPVAFVEDELKHLVEYSFMNKLPGNKYLTNIYIIKPNNDEKRMDEILTIYANKVCDIYIPLLLKMHDDNNENIYSPENDKNFLMWSIITYACYKKLIIVDDKKDIQKYMVKRKDIGETIVSATVVENVKTQNNQSINKEYIENIDVVSEHDNYQISTWQFASNYDDRDGNIANWRSILFEDLYEYIIGKITETQSNIDKFIELYEKGYIVSNKENVYVNMTIINMPQNDFDNILPQIPEELICLGQEFDKMMYEFNKIHFPKHIQGLCRVVNQNCLTSGRLRIKILENLLHNNVLKPIKKVQRKTVNMMLFCNVPKQLNC